MPLAPRRIRSGIVGGGFIGPVHAIAGRMHNRYRLMAGTLPPRPEAAPVRIVPAVQALLRRLPRYGPDGGRLSRWRRGVTITAPNHIHHAIARTFPEAGICGWFLAVMPCSRFGNNVRGSAAFWMRSTRA